MWKLSLYKKSDQKKFSQYISQSFHKKYILGDPRYLDWQYKNSLYLLRADNKIVGHFGFRDLLYKVRNQTRKVRVLINLFILEQFRAFGFGALLIKKVLDTPLPALVAGYRLPAIKVFKKVKLNQPRRRVGASWQEGILGRYIGLVNEVSKKKFLGMEIQPLKVFRKKEINTWWARMRRQFPVTVERNYDYLFWRFFSHPFFRYQVLSARQNGNLSGLLIWRADGQGKYQMGRIVDFIADRKTAAPLLNAFLSELKKKKIKVGEFLLSGDFYKKELKAAGFFNVAGTKFESYPVLLNPVSFKRHNINIAHTLGVDFKSCYFTKAEGDQDRANPH